MHNIFFATKVGLKLLKILSFLKLLVQSHSPERELYHTGTEFFLS